MTIILNSLDVSQFKDCLIVYPLRSLPDIDRVHVISLSYLEEKSLRTLWFTLLPASPHSHAVQQLRYFIPDIEVSEPLQRA